MCDTHLAKYERYRGRKLDDLPDELLGAQVNRMQYLRSLDERHANEALRSGANPGKLNAAGQVIDIISGNYEGANWWQLNAMRKSQTSNSLHQIHMNGVAKLDAQMAQVREVIARRREGAGPALAIHPGGAPDALGVLKLRFAKGEITKEQFEEMRRVLEQ